MRFPPFNAICGRTRQRPRIRSHSLRVALFELFATSRLLFRICTRPAPDIFFEDYFLFDFWVLIFMHGTIMGCPTGFQDPLIAVCAFLSKEDSSFDSFKALMQSETAAWECLSHAHSSSLPEAPFFSRCVFHACGDFHSAVPCFEHGVRSSGLTQAGILLYASFTGYVFSTCASYDRAIQSRSLYVPLINKAQNRKSDDDRSRCRACLSCATAVFRASRSPVYTDFAPFSRKKSCEPSKIRKVRSFFV